MYEIWTIPTTNMTYTRSQNYKNMMVGEHGIKTFKVFVVVLLLLVLLYDVFVPTNTRPFFIFGQVICPNILKY